MLHTREETAEVDLQLHSTKTVALLLGQFEPLEIPLRVVTYHGSQDNGDGGRQRWQGRTRWWQRVRESRRMRRQRTASGLLDRVDEALIAWAVALIVEDLHDLPHALVEVSRRLRWV